VHQDNWDFMSVTPFPHLKSQDRELYAELAVILVKTTRHFGMEDAIHKRKKQVTIAFYIR